MKDRPRVKLSANQGRLVVLQLAVMLNSGVSILKALETISKAGDEAVKMFGLRVYHSVSVGGNLSRAFAQATDFFSVLHISLLKTGEETGKVALLLRKISEQLEREQSLRRQLLSALTYPLGILLLNGLIAAFMGCFMLPELLSAAGDALEHPPFPTRVLSGIFQNGGVLTTLFLVSLCTIPWFFGSAPQAKALRVWLSYESPVVGRLLSQLELARLSRQLSLMLHTGLTVRHSLASLEPENPKFQDGIKQVLESLTEGLSLLRSFEAAGVFERDYLAIIEVGQQSGRLAKALTNQADFLELNAERDLRDLVKLVEPFSMVIMGFMVAFVLLACFMPIYQLSAQYF